MPDTVHLRIHAISGRQAYRWSLHTTPTGWQLNTWNPATKAHVVTATGTTPDEASYALGEEFQSLVDGQLAMAQESLARLRAALPLDITDDTMIAKPGFRPVPARTLRARHAAERHAVRRSVEQQLRDANDKVVAAGWPPVVIPEWPTAADECLFHPFTPVPQV